MNKLDRRGIGLFEALERIHRTAVKNIKNGMPPALWPRDKLTKKLIDM